MNMSLLVLILVALFVVIAIAKLKRDKVEALQRPLRFFGKVPLTRTEQLLFHRLAQALPDCVVLAQVQISQLVGIEKGPHWQGWFNKISRKSADFVVCLKDFTVVCVIELDDRSHERDDRKRSDDDKDTALTGAGIKLLRWKAVDMPDVDTIRKTFLE
ncbi:MAG: DUF2726 domain-containing protein [Proteobacteria bacterium]|nr:DUF2726 domain-containing protein [Pseudomonadota bacterium]